MIDLKELFEIGVQFHGHKCPAMPMGLRAGLAAMRALGVERAQDGQLMALVELGEDHCATCFADGVQMATGCTFGKGNIRKQHYGKFGLTLIDKKTRRAVRVTPKPEVMQANRQSPFMTEYRKKGIPASQVPAEVVQPLLDKVLGAPAEQLLSVGEVHARAWHDRPHSFEGFLCELCGEMTVEPYGRVLGDKRVCIPCEEKSIGWASEG